LQAPEDLIEEIGRVIGYETIKPVMPVSTIIPAHEAEAVAFGEKVRDALSAAGMTEAYNYSLDKNGGFALDNPMSEERRALRPSLAPGLIKNAEDNLRFFDEVKMFEIGKTFQISGFRKSIGISEIPGLPNERWSAGGIMAKKTGSGELFYELKGIVDGLLESLGIPGRWYDDYKSTPEPASVEGPWQKGKTAEIKIGDVDSARLQSLVGHVVVQSPNKSWLKSVGSFQRRPAILPIHELMAKSHFKFGMLHEL